MSDAAGSPVKLVAFDLGGVMIDVDEAIPIAQFAEMSGRSHDEVFAAIFSPDRKEPIETGAISPGEHARRSCETLGLNLSVDEFWRIHCTSHTPNAGVGEIVREVASLRQITIASNLPLPHWEWTRENIPFAGSFTPPILSFELGVMKPNTGYYHELMRRSGYEAQAIFFTDDRVENVSAAAALGIRAFHFRSAAKLRSDLQSCGLRI
jgi:FMN phosphatase YigB (HAD superfamily)